MMSTPLDDRSQLLARAKQGHAECLGTLLDQYRNYLNLVARDQIDLHLAARVNPSDMVQETFLQACRHFPDFRGSTEHELLAWLRRILARNIVAAFHHNRGAQKRDVRRNVSLEQIVGRADQSVSRLQSVLASPGSSPSATAHREELALTVADRLSELPADYREVIVLRNLQGHSFNEVASRMNRTPAAVRKLWTRAIGKLKLVCEELEP
jgi:RNA polymerase sigma-70 factor (ECF subfamily)